MYRSLSSNSARAVVLALAVISCYAVALAARAAPPATSGASARTDTDRSIIVYKDAVTDTERDAVLQSVHALAIKRLKHAISADVVASLSAHDRAIIALDPSVKRIDPDSIVSISKGNTAANAATPQSIQWNITRIHAPEDWPLGDTGAGIKVAVIDTGISTSHPDLVGNLKGGINTINSRKSYNDDNGHGSHVAGIIAAVNNTIGVVGVAHQASLYAVKALNAQGSGYLSDIIEGIDWSIANHMRVINMSLGTTQDVQSFHDAVIRAHQAGITIAAAAGNDGGAVNYPARYAEVIAVAASDAGDAVPSWSSRGPEVALTAPGVSVTSTYKSSSYATLSGTSMATPHVTGAIALLLGVPSKCDTDNNGTCSPDEIRSRLEQTADDRGAAGKDNVYGYGIVNAYAAVTQ